MQPEKSNLSSTMKKKLFFIIFCSFILSNYGFSNFLLTTETVNTARSYKLITKDVQQELIKSIKKYNIKLSKLHLLEKILKANIENWKDYSNFSSETYFKLKKELSKTANLSNSEIEYKKQQIFKINKKKRDLYKLTDQLFKCNIISSFHKLKLDAEIRDGFINHEYYLLNIAAICHLKEIFSNQEVMKFAVKDLREKELISQTSARKLYKKLENPISHHFSSNVFNSLFGIKLKWYKKDFHAKTILEIFENTKSFLIHTSNITIKSIDEIEPVTILSECELFKRWVPNCNHFFKLETFHTEHYANYSFKRNNHLNFDLLDWFKSSEFHSLINQIYYDIKEKNSSLHKHNYRHFVIDYRDHINNILNNFSFQNDGDIMSRISFLSEGNLLGVWRVHINNLFDTQIETRELIGFNIPLGIYYDGNEPYYSTNTKRNLIDSLENLGLLSNLDLCDKKVRKYIVMLYNQSSKSEILNTLNIVYNPTSTECIGSIMSSNYSQDPLFNKLILMTDSLFNPMNYSQSKSNKSSDILINFTNNGNEYSFTHTYGKNKTIVCMQYVKIASSVIKKENLTNKRFYYIPKYSSGRTKAVIFVDETLKNKIENLLNVYLRPY